MLIHSWLYYWLDGWSKKKNAIYAIYCRKLFRPAIEYFRPNLEKYSLQTPVSPFFWQAQKRVDGWPYLKQSGSAIWQKNIEFRKMPLQVLPNRFLGNFSEKCRWLVQKEKCIRTRILMISFQTSHLDYRQQIGYQSFTALLDGSFKKNALPAPSAMPTTKECTARP